VRFVSITRADAKLSPTKIIRRKIIYSYKNAPNLNLASNVVEELPNFADYKMDEIVVIMHYFAVISVV
jgi:hypothetical protein